MPKVNDLILGELKEAAEVLEKFFSNQQNLENISEAAKLMVQCAKKGGKIIACGNGGSACDAMHFAEELTGKFREARDPVAALAITDAAHLTCTANDFGFSYVFSRYIRALGKKGDILLAISTSGNSDNVLRAAELARQKEMKVVALTGKNGGSLAEFADVLINVPHQGYSDRIQEVHIKIIHILILLIEKGLE